MFLLWAKLWGRSCDVLSLTSWHSAVTAHEPATPFPHLRQYTHALATDSPMSLSSSPSGHTGPCNRLTHEPFRITVRPLRSLEQAHPWAFPHHRQATQVLATGSPMSLSASQSIHSGPCNRLTHEPFRITVSPLRSLQQAHPNIEENHSWIGIVKIHFLSS